MSRIPSAGLDKIGPPYFEIHDAGWALIALLAFGVLAAAYSIGWL